MAEDQFTDLLDRLDGVRQRGTDAADARCPAHEDGKASLSVARGLDGRIVIQCHAGCRWDDVLKAVGMDRSAAFGEPHISAEYTYTDRDSNPLYVVERWEPKSFKQRLANGVRKSPKPSDRVLYNLPVIDAVRDSDHPSLFYVEGEHDVSTLAAHGYAATTTLGGANKPWEPQYTEALDGLTVVIVADNDPPGRKWAHQVAGYLAGRCTTKIVVPPRGVKDVTELLEAGFAITDLVPLADTMGEVAEAFDYPVKQVEWLWPGRLPANMLTLLEGDPGTGKSTLTMEIIACLTTGRALPGADVRHPPMRVGMLSDEDNWGMVVVPRLQAAGADLRKVLHFKGIRHGDYLTPYSLSDLATLRHDVVKMNATVLVIDPLMAYLGGNDMDSHRDQHVRGVLGPLVQWAEEDGITIIAIRHFSKGSAGGKAIYRGGGSIGFTGQARAVLQTAEHPGGDGKFALAVAKCNLAPLAPSLGYGMEVDVLHDVARIKWDPVPLAQSAQQLQHPHTERPETEGPGLEAREWLAWYLGDGVTRAWKDVAKAGKEEGHTEHTLRHVRNQVAIRHLGAGGAATSTWTGIVRIPICPNTNIRQMEASAGDDEGWTPTTVLEKAGLKIEDDEHLPPFAYDLRSGKWEDRENLQCRICGSKDGLVTADAVTTCRLHNPLVYTDPTTEAPS